MEVTPLLGFWLSIFTANLGLHEFLRVVVKIERGNSRQVDARCLVYRNTELLSGHTKHTQVTGNT